MLRSYRKVKQRENDSLSLCKELGFCEKDMQTLANTE